MRGWATGLPARLALLALAGLLTACGSSPAGSSAPSVSRSSSAPSTVASSSATSVTTRATVSRARAPVDPCHRAEAGRPQTTQLPSSATHCFRHQMTALWRGVRLDSPAAARAAFFPLAAYAQVKAIADPAGDYTGRLWADFDADLAAAHALLGDDARAARLVTVSLPAGFAHWVPPGACYNSSGYYELPNARLEYRVGGELRSFGIASMISWRGVWYVIHLGAVLRPDGGGVVDDPEVGPGTPAASSTC